MGEIKPPVELLAKIRVIGVGGSGGSAVNRMIEAGVKGVEFIAINTDVQALHYNKAAKKIHIGKSITRGLGAGMNPELGKQAAEESQNDIRDALKDSDMVFVTCGLGGGTGTGAAPVVAEIARDLGALTVAVVTKPFAFEGAQRKNISERGLAELSDKVDTIITIPNDKILQVIDKKTSLMDAFRIVDEILRQGVQGIAEVITMPGEINVDFADVKAVMSNAGSALMGIGEATGENKAIEAAKAAISSPLLEMSIEGARGILFTIMGGSDLSMNEVNEAAKVITASADEDAKIIFGSVVDKKMKDSVKITVVATGFDNGARKGVLKEREVSYSPNSFLKDDEDSSVSEAHSFRKSVEREDIVDNYASKASTIIEAQSQPARKKGYANTINSQPEEDEEDSDIPAFIRRQMKNKD
ncbi:cell division protein FtsZ [Patescibacteria group bacterium]|nr:cell division protein FtsZ [Patescibacteria group bacterium]